MAKPDIDWQSIAAKAMRTRAGFEALLLTLEPWIKSTSQLYCKSDPQGAAQEARSHIFVRVYKQKRIDLTKSSASIGNLLRTAVRNIILNEERRAGRNGMNCFSHFGVPGRERSMKLERPALLPLSAGEDIQSAESKESTAPFPIPHYAEYFELHGNIAGAAEYCEKKYGYDAKKVAAEFERVVAQLK